MIMTKKEFGKYMASYMLGNLIFIIFIALPGFLAFEVLQLFNVSFWQVSLYVYSIWWAIVGVCRFILGDN